MRKVKGSIYITLILGIISFVFLFIDVVIILNLQKGLADPHLEIRTITYSLVPFALFYISFFYTIYLILRFMRKSVKKVY
jgi:hypothetical protein